MRCVFHIDLDAFFASVEIVKNPSLRGKPVIVGGRPDRRGVVSTCSYEARKFGVRSAMPLSEAYRRCPKGIFLEGDYSSYRAYSDTVFSIFYEYTPFVEVVSIDEAYLDVTAKIAEGISAKDLAIMIHQQVFAATQLTCSIGIATNKIVSKIAAAKAKPNGIFEVVSGTEEAFLAPLPIESLPGIGAKTKVILNMEGYSTVGDLQALSLDAFVNLHGAFGYYYYHACRGIDKRPVDWETHPPKSLGAETTFENDVADEQILRDEMHQLLEKVVYRLRAHKMRAGRIHIKLRFSDFRTISRSMTLETYSNNFETIEGAVMELFSHNYTKGTPLRLIGVSLEKLNDSYWQPTFFKTLSL